MQHLTDKLGSDWITCTEPESIMLCLSGTASIDEDMIQAIKTCIVSDLPWADPFVFENVVDGINGNPVMPDTLTIPPLEEISAAVYIMSIIKPDAVYSRDVMKYICSCAISDGLVWLPENLIFAAEFMADTDTGLQFQVKASIEASGFPVYDYPYNETPVEIQLLKLAAIDYAAKDTIGL